MSTHPTSRPGSVYVLVIVAMAVVGAVVLSSLRIATGRQSDGGLVADSVQAGRYARSAIDIALDTINNDPTWRWTSGDGAWRSGVVTDRGTLGLSATGGDGAPLRADAWQPARLTGTGAVGEARSILEVQVGLQGSGVASTSETIFSNTALAVWPLEGDAAEATAERVRGNAATFVAGTDAVRPGAVPGLGTSTAPWFATGAHAKADASSDYDAIRTISLWFWADGVTTTQGLACRDAATVAAGSWALYLNSGILFARVESLLGSSLAGAGVTARAWHQVVLVLEDNRGVLYLDGVEAARTSTLLWGYWDARLNTEFICLGASHSSSLPGTSGVTSPFTGSICHVLLLGEPLSALEVSALYAGSPAPARYRVLADTWNRVTE